MLLEQYRDKHQVDIIAKAVRNHTKIALFGIFLLLPRAILDSCSLVEVGLPGMT